MKFESVQDKFDSTVIRAHSLQFGRKIFEDKIKKYIDDKSAEFFSGKR
jgi:hypothetical protein